MIIWSHFAIEQKRNCYIIAIIVFGSLQNSIVPEAESLVTWLLICVGGGGANIFNKNALLASLGTQSLVRGKVNQKLLP